LSSKNFMCSNSFVINLNITSEYFLYISICGYSDYIFNLANCRLYVLFNLTILLPCVHPYFCLYIVVVLT
jgi:hypothetical protein